MQVERRKTKYCLIATAALLLVLLAQPALATKYWVGPNPNTNWTTAGNWSNTAGGPGGAGQPGAGESAVLVSATSKTATLNTVTPQLIELLVDGRDGGTFTLNENGGALSALTEYIGYDGKGVYNQSAGSNTLAPNGDLFLGVNSGSTGTYNLTGGSLSANSLYAGVPGTGVFNQSSANVTVNSILVLGEVAGSSGTYTMTGGTLNVGLFEYIGFGGSGTFTQSGGTHIGGFLNIGYGSNGSYKMSGGSLSARSEVIGSGGTGSFTQNGGSNTISQNLILGPNLGGSGTYTMTGGNLSVIGDEVIAFDGTGTFTQSSGSHTITGDLEVGRLSGSNGTFKMTSGSLNVTGDENIGDGGTGTFSQSSGTHSIGGSLDIGISTGSTGNFTMSSGSLNVGRDLKVGRLGGSTGTFNMSSGSLSVGGNEFIGYFGPGSFTQTSGSNTANGDFTLGVAAGVTGTYTMTSGSLTVKGANGEVIGQSGAGVFTQTSGSNTVTNGKLTLAAQPGSLGTYNLNSGSVIAPGGIQINGSTGPGNNGLGTGVFNVTGSGTVTGPVANYGNVNNYGTVTWNGTFTNNNVYTAGTSAPSSSTTQTFNQDLVVNPTGYIVANSPLKAGPPLNPLIPQDVFIFQGNFQNQSTQSALWNTANAEMEFVAGASNTHNLYIPGVDMGRTPSPPIAFSWYALDIGTGQTLNLVDGNTSNTSTAQYVGEMLGAIISGTTVTNIVGSSNPSDPTIIYYDKTLPQNAYLGGLDYTFASGYGELMWDPPGGPNPDVSSAVPVPPSVLLLGSGLLGLGALGWRRKRITG